MQGLNQESNPFSLPAGRSLHLAFKGALVAILVAGFLLYRFLSPEYDVTCIVDVYQDATEALNRQFVQDRGEPAFEGNPNQLSLTGKVMIGTGQVMMDLWIAVLGLVWFIKVKNVRAFIALGAFFIIRGVIFLNIQKFPFPHHIVWRSPGLFSFTVPYDHTRDFFYSGHTGTLTIILLELITLNIRPLYILAALSWVFMLNMLLITKVHYVVDIVGGLVFSIWFYRTSCRIVVYSDKLLSLPFVGGMWIYKDTCKQTEKTGEEEQKEGSKVDGEILTNNNKITSQRRRDSLYESPKAYEKRSAKSSSQHIQQ